MTPDFNEYRQRLQSVFDELPRDGELFLDSEVETDIDAASYANEIAHRTWASLTEEEAIFNRGSMYYLTPLGFQYFLPAFLLHGLSNVDIADRLISELDPSGLGVHAHMNILTAPQKEIVQDWLDIMTEKFQMARIQFR